MRISDLSSDVCSSDLRIAAGEVVERPASALKELVENAIDARATAIAVTLEGGGIGRIEIADNGCGMTADEMRLAVERHATSKLPSDHLDAIPTPGFPGEELPSYPSVAPHHNHSPNAEGSEHRTARGRGSG